MQTRAAARRLLEAAAVVSAVAGTKDATPTNSSATEQISTSKPVANDGSDDMLARGAKRKRPEKKQQQPAKGGWVLPHGMGAELTGQNTESDGNDSADQLGPSFGESATSASNSTQEGSKTNPHTSGQAKQTRLSLRVTKAGLHKEPGQQKPDVVLTEPDGISNIKQEDPPRKRIRFISAATKADPAVASSSTSADEPLALAIVKKEEKDEIVSGQPIRKLLIFKGVTVKDDVAARAAIKIIVDATQILDPNYKLILKRGKENPYGLTPGYSPYPYRRVPTPEACEDVHRILTELHGEVKQPEKMPAASLEIAGCGEVPCVLDALLRTLISGNTTMAMADAAIKNLAQHYGLRQSGTGAGSINWDKVRLSSHQELTQVIRIAGNGPNRSRHIKQILDMVYQENLELAKNQPPATTTGRQTRKTGKTNDTATSANLLSLDHMHSMTKDEAMARFVTYPGVGIKTAACVTLFCLRMPCFAVDTHVHKFCRWLGWVPERADPDNCFRHGDATVPDHLKYGLHQLFIRHGQQCHKCRKVTKPGTKDWEEAAECPLEHLLDRSKDEAAAKVRPKRKVVEVKEEETEDDEEVESVEGGSDGEMIVKGKKKGKVVGKKAKKAEKTEEVAEEEDAGEEGEEEEGEEDEGEEDEEEEGKKGEEDVDDE